ncbi:excinuclease ABC subunit UvrB [Candidatus Microgenomates bacterium]|nr:excinuclease ABC subunit UvrB [Candidatus Microgenomates bacterium]
MPKFKLHSTFQPSGDQGQAIARLCDGLKKGYRDQTLLGVTGSGKTFTMAKIIEKTQRPTLVIAHNKTLAAQLASEFRAFFPENAVHYFVSYYDYYQPEAYIPKTDTYIEKDTAINDEIDRLRHAATMALLTRRDVIIVASVSCIYGLGEPEDYLRQSFELKVGQKISRETVIRQFVGILYERNDIELARGKFRVRGDVLEIIPAYGEDPVRISFFGDEIEMMAEIDGITGDVGQKLSELRIFPAKHFLTGAEKLKVAMKNIREEAEERVKYFQKEGKLLEAQRIGERVNYDLEMLTEVGYISGIENYSRHLTGRPAGAPPSTLIDFYLGQEHDVRRRVPGHDVEHRVRQSKCFLMFIDESHQTIPQIGGMYAGDQARKQNLIDYGFRLPSARDNRPLKFEEFDAKIQNVIYVSATPAEYELKKSRQVVEQVIRPTGLLDPKIEIRPTEHQIDDLMAEIKKTVDKKQRVLVTTLTKKLAEDISSYLSEYGLKTAYLHSEVDTLDRLDILRDLRLGIYDILVGINLLREGLDLPEVSLVAILDADKEGFLRSDVSLIQTMGRAARHSEGRVIMYADRITGSMQRAIDETTRRRKIQEEHNKKHGIVPTSISKVVAEDSDWRQGEGKEIKKLRNYEIKDTNEKRRIIKDLEAKMDLAARELRFEDAGEYRDRIVLLEKNK